MEEGNQATATVVAAYQIAPPERFNFSRPEEWPRWIQRFERFRQASGLCEKSQEIQVNTLIYVMGDEADDILSSLGLSEEQKLQYESVQQAFQNHFIKKRNPIYKRAKFNQRRQEEEESVDSFVTALYGLAKHCDYGGLHDQMIRDRLVVGLRDAVLSEKLQMDPDLSLQKAISTARQSEAVKMQQSVVRGDSRTNVDAIRAKQHYVKPKPQPKKGQPKAPNPHTRVELPQKTCIRCGRAPFHSRDFCPARNAKCHKCKKTGHFQLQCRMKSVRTVLADQDDEVYIAAVHQKPEKSPWIVTLGVNGSPVKFKIDTGADVSVLPEAIFKKLRGATLQHTSKSLIGPNKQSLNVS